MNSISSLASSWEASIELQKKSIREVYVKRRKEAEISNSLDKVIREDLWIQWIKTSLSVRYLVDWLSDEEYERSLPTVFAELPVEELVDPIEFESSLWDKRILNIESLPWQYDDTVAAMQDCLMLQTGERTHSVRAFTTIVFEGDISDSDMKKINKYLVNPVEKQNTEITDKQLLRESPIPEDIKTIEWFIGADITWLDNIIKEYGLAMSRDDLLFAQWYFQKKDRDPTETELKVLDVYRSDHCRHGTFIKEIKDIIFKTEYQWVDTKSDELMLEIMTSHDKYQEIREELWRTEKPDTLMELATIATKYFKNHPNEYPNISNLVESEENNACTFRTTVEMEDGSCEEREIMFKNETHNHPTEIEPFWWAATCLWWCIRDPLSGRSWVFQAMRITWAADPTAPISSTLAGKLSQRTISQIASEWFSSYGNQIGIAAGEVREYFHPWYLAKRFEVWYVIAWAPASNIRREPLIKGDKIIMIGGKTGRDGIGAAAWSSKIHDSNSVSDLWAEVQKGNPIEEGKLARLFLDPKFTHLVKKCNDFWAWGVAVAIGELTRWLTIDLDKVPVKYDGLNGTELATSESQERMAIAIDPNDYNKVMEVIQTYNLEWTEVAEVTNDKDNSQDKLIMTRRWNNIVDLDRDFLDMAWANKPMEEIIIDPNLSQKVSQDCYNYINQNIYEYIKKWDYKEAFLENLKQLSVSSQKGIWSKFDNSVWSSNVLAMYGGKYQITPQNGMVSKIPTFNWIDSITTSISTHGFNPRLAEQSAYLWAISAIKLSISKQVALWWSRKTAWLSLQEYFWKLGEDPKKRWETYSALLGAFIAQIELGIPAIWGKDSMSGTFKPKDGNEINVPPSLVAFAANTGTITNVISSEFKEAWNKVIFLPSSSRRTTYKKMLDEVEWLIRSWVVRSSSVVESGWIATSLAKMSFWNRIGFEEEANLTEKLFQENLWWIILEIDDSAEDTKKKLSDLYYSDVISLGITTEDTSINICWDKISIQEAQQAWTGTFEKVHPTTAWWWEVSKIIPYTASGLVNNFNILKWIKPKVLIPVFPGTNSELDTAHAIRRAGMEAETFTFQTQTPELLIESTKRFAELLKDCQMVVFPWWFSAGDQPHWSAKFITSIVRMNIVRDAIQDFLDNPNTLTLGICNGFQALIKLWLFDEWKITDHLTESSPTLTHNTTWRHVTDQVWLQVASTLSPMMSKVQIWETFIIPISHGEWRLYMRDQEMLQRYIQNGQVILQYLDHDWNPTNQYNWSLEGIAGLCSPDGRILWLMPHPERSGMKLFQNIPWNHHLPIFESAANAFWVDQYKIK